MGGVYSSPATGGDISVLNFASQSWLRVPSIKRVSPLRIYLIGVNFVGPSCFCTEYALPLSLSQGHANCIHCIAFSSDGQQLATGSEDKTARLWDLSSIPHALDWVPKTPWIGSPVFDTISSQTTEVVADVESERRDGEAPYREQLKLVIQRAEGARILTLPRIKALCNQAGIRADNVERVVAAGKFEEEAVVDKFMFLLLAMTCDSFNTVTEGIFELFGHEVGASRFISLVGYLGPDMDPSITTEFLADLATALRDTAVVTHALMAQLEVLKDKLCE